MRIDDRYAAKLFFEGQIAKDTRAKHVRDIDTAHNWPCDRHMHHCNYDNWLQILHRDEQ
jgi:hypothetical protein